MRYVVTGGAGFIGTNLVRSLLDDGREIVVADNFPTDLRQNVAGLPNTRIVEADIRDTPTLSKQQPVARSFFTWRRWVRSLDRSPIRRRATT